MKPPWSKPRSARHKRNDGLPLSQNCEAATTDHRHMIVGIYDGQEVECRISNGTWTYPSIGSCPNVRCFIVE